MRTTQPLTSGHRAVLTKWLGLIFFNRKCISAFADSVVGGLYRTLKGTGEENVFVEGTGGKIWRERSVVMGNWEEKFVFE